MARDGGVGSWMERRARRSPERIAIVHGGVQRTYRELAARIIRLANALRDRGVGRGDRVVWLGANHPAFLELLFATAKLGAVFAPINHRLEPTAIEAISGTYEPVLVVTEPADVERMVAVGRDAAIDEAISVDDLCILHHTSGTTGTPKGIMLTHGNVTWNVVNFLSVADFREDDRTVAIAPFFRSGGLGVNVLTVLFKGGTVIIPDTATPDAILDAMTTHRVTIGFGNPDLLEALTHSAAWRDADLSSVRLFMTGGAPVPERLLRTYLERGITFLQGYGLSEAAPLVLLLDPDHALRKVGSAGTPPLLVDVRIARPDGTTCEPNETGELLARGPNVMAGYWRRPDLAPIDVDGWLSTGDAARIDDEGFVWIVDRVVDGFTTAGGRVYPGDIERVLAAHPAVEDVGVVGVGGHAYAFVVVAAGAQTTEAELLAHCGAHLAPHAIPASIQRVERIPRTSVGKMMRHELAARVVH